MLIHDTLQVMNDCIKLYYVRTEFNHTLHNSTLHVLYYFECLPSILVKSQ